MVPCKIISNKACYQPQISMRGRALYLKQKNQTTIQYKLKLKKKSKSTLEEKLLKKNTIQVLILNTYTKFEVIRKKKKDNPFNCFSQPFIPEDYIYIHTHRNFWKSSHLSISRSLNIKSQRPHYDFSRIFSNTKLKPMYSLNKQK